MLAVQKNYINIVEYLIVNGADPLLTNIKGDNSFAVGATSFGFNTQLNSIQDFIFSNNEIGAIFLKYCKRDLSQFLEIDINDDLRVIGSTHTNSLSSQNNDKNNEEMLWISLAMIVFYVLSVFVLGKNP